ncbi:Ig-like domain-containing protein [Paenibacillus filicis]|uniref:Ig-like domain-containing protein n=1 Tax=Paenibacillus gyeongsangnamensis TaxID=3388067 RepID=A0ABT4Q8P3_9BACL|nr:Ig-like domain-containing protein [Paenibacillus filicis]MCZ8513243.1 Ig-like domain-containing protein [Paenibacillus filicis]
MHVVRLGGTMRREGGGTFLRRFAASAGLFIALMFVALWIGTEAFAATFTVDNTGDGSGNCWVTGQGQCTLRDAIQQSNSVGGTNTINIKAGTSYKLVSGQINITSSVTLIGDNGNAGSSPALTVIQGDGTHRIFEVQPGANVSFTALTLQGGINNPDTSGYGGGAVAAKLGAGNTLTLSNSVVKDSMTTGSGLGGGVYVTGPAGSGLVLNNNTVIQGNTAGQSGGGLYAEGDLNISLGHASFVSNTASTTLGGGMAVLPASPSGGTVVIQDSSFSKNTAQGAGNDGIGGGLYLGVPADIKNTTFSGNSSNSDGGGLFLSFFQNNVNLTTVTFDSNSSVTGTGGGLFVQNGNPKLTGTTFQKNTAKTAPNDFGTNGFPVAPYAPAVPLQTSDGTAYGGGTWTSKDVITDAAADVSVDDSATWNPGPVTLSADGNYKVVMKLTDKNGNAVLQRSTVQIDKTKPTLTLSAVSNGANYAEGTWATKDVVITANSSDTGSGLASTKYSLDGGTTWTDYTAPVTMSTDGTYSVIVKTVDNAGNTEQKSFAVKLDKTAPSLTTDWKTADGQPYTLGSWTNQPVTLTVVSSDAGSGVASTVYSVDGGSTWVNYTNPVNLSADGQYNVQVRVTDQAGNVTSQGGTVKIDQTKPTLTITATSGGANYAEGAWATKDVTLTAAVNDTGSGLASTKYSLDGGTTWTDYTAPVTMSTDGTYSVIVKTVDNAGNTEQKSFAVKLDKTAPVLTADWKTADGQPYTLGSWTNQPVTLTVVSSDAGSGVASTVYSVDGGSTWVNYTNPVNLSADGQYAIQIKAMDIAGNVSSQNGTVKIDQTKPTLTITATSGGANYAEGTWAIKDVVFTAAVNDTGSGLASTKYSLDGGTTWTDYMAPVTMSTDGTYSVIVKTVDNAGNTEQKSFAVKLDKTAPSLTTDWKTADGLPYTLGSWTNQPVTLTVASSDAGSGVTSTVYSVDGGLTWINYTNPVNLSATGQYDIQVKTTDQAGNVSSQSGTVKIDQTKPTLTITTTTDGTNYAEGTWATKDVVLTVDANNPGGSGLASTKYSLDGGTTWTDYTAPVTMSTDGTYSIAVKTVDNAGNTEQKSFNVKLDKTAPSLTMDWKTADGQPYTLGSWTNQPVTLTVASSDAGSGVASTVYSVDGGSTWVNYTNPVNLSATGQYDVQVKATDQAGNVSSQSGTVKIDQIKPTLTITATSGSANYTEGTWASKDVVVSAAVNDTGGSGLASTKYSLDGGNTWTDYTAPVTMSIEGTYSVTVKTVDNAGNIEQKSFSVKLDKTAPVLGASVKANGVNYVDGTWSKNPVKLTLNASDAPGGSSLQSTQVSLDGGATWTDYSGEITIPDGNYSVKARAADYAGNVTEAGWNIKVSTILPTLGLTLTPNTLTNGDVTAAVTATVYGSGNTAELRYAAGDQPEGYFSSGGGTVIPTNAGTSNGNFTLQDNGFYTVYAKDLAGNEARQLFEVNTIIRTVPTLTLTAQNSGWTSGSVTVSVYAAVYDKQLGNALSELKWVEGNRDLDLSGTDAFSVSENGTYTVRAKDKAGNTALQTITIANILRTEPMITTHSSPFGPGNEQAQVTVTASVYGTGNSVAAIKWMPGSRSKSDFAGQAGNPLTNGAFLVNENGIYTVYVRDQAGNEAVMVVTVREVNHPPVVSDSTVYGTTNTVLHFGSTSFNFSDSDQDSLYEIQILTLPANGKLKWNGIPVTVNQTVYSSGLNGMTLEPDAGWSGTTSFDWNGSDGMVYAKTTARLTMIIASGNLPPTAGTVSLSVRADTPQAGRLIGSDPEGGELSFSIKTQGSLGTLTLLNEHTGDFVYAPKPGITGKDTVTYTVYDNQRASATGTVEVNILPKDAPGPSASADLACMTVSTGRLTPAFDAGVLNYNVTVSREVYAITVSAAVYQPRATLTVNGVTVASGAASSPIALQYGSNSIVIQVTAEDGKTNKVYTLQVYREPRRSDDSPSAGGGAAPAPPAPAPVPGLNGEMNGKPVDHLGTVTTSTVDGLTVLTATLDTAQVESLLSQVTGNPTVTLEVKGGGDRILTELNGSIAGMLAGREASVQVQTELGTYTVPLAGIRMDALAAKFGNAVSMSDLSLRISISKPPPQLIQRLQNQAAAGQYSIVMPPVDFSITATYKGTSFEIHEFSRMVSRELPVPAGVNAGQITTAVVGLEDGSVYHVPTVIASQGGQTTLRVNSLTNSTYMAISSVKSFTDMTGHWAQREVNNMASRLIVNGLAEGEYGPDAPVTRAQFTAIVIRALGLSENTASASKEYKDVQPKDWFAGAVTRANTYGLVNGYEDGTFRPEKTITREEALVMISRAMKLAGKPVDLASASPMSILSGFKDSSEVGDWAMKEAAEAVQSGLVQGSDAGLQPKVNMTRAETAVILYRLLIRSNLISP